MHLLWACSLTVVLLVAEIGGGYACFGIAKTSFPVKAWIESRDVEVSAPGLRAGPAESRERKAREEPDKLRQAWVTRR